MIEATLLLLAKNRVEGRRDHTPMHTVADQFENKFTVAVMYGFMKAKKALGKNANVTAAVSALRKTLEDSLPKVLLNTLIAGGETGVARLVKELRVAGDVEGHPFHGNQWTNGEGSGPDDAKSYFKTPSEFKLEDAQYDVKTRLSKDLMVVAEVDLNLLHSEYGNDARVREMSAAMKAGDKFPPLTLELKENGKLGILDGRTRVAALRELGVKGKVPAVIRLYDQGVEDSLPNGVSVDDKRTTSLRAASLRTAKGPTTATITMKFDAKNERAAKWARDHAAELIDGISDTTEQAIKDAVARAQEEGGLDEQYDEILDAVGNVDRAQVIARTESMTAANEGNRQGWDQAVNEGLLTGDERRVWIATSDACPQCDELDGEETSLDGSYSGDGEDGPPLHPNCRCTEGIV